MAPDEFQQAWQSQASQTRVTVDADLLRERVLRRQREFRSTIFWRDVREIGVSLSLIPVWFILGAVTRSPWTWYLTVPVLVWIAGFMWVYRMRHPQRSGDADRSLRESVNRSLAEVEDQIWLLRNVFWWYLLPPGVSLMAFFAHVSWLSLGHWAAALAAMLLPSGFVFVVYYLVYLLNQRAVRLELEPRRQELLALLNSLSDEPTGEVTGAYPILMNDRPHRCSTQRLFVGDRRTALVLLIGVPLILLIGVPPILFLAVRQDQAIPSGPAPSHPERSPFTAVRWQQFQPEVEVDGEWFTLVSLDGIPVAEIVAFSRRTYRGRWQKRFEEDLVQVLTRMGHPPGDTVTLVVRSLSSQQTQILEEVPMTRENRHKIREAALNADAETSDARDGALRSRDRNAHTSDRFWERFTIVASVLFTLLVFALVLGSLGAFRRSYAGEPKSDGPAGDALASQVAALRKQKGLVGLAAMVNVDGQLVATAVDGERKTWSGKAIELGDQWHLGSITKSITATLIARVVESGRMQWSDTVGECFADAVHENWKPVKLRQLLTHTAGAPPNFAYHVRAKQPLLGEDCTRQRREAVLEVLAGKPIHPPGEKFAYSNVGYTIAGAMAEAATGVSWEDLVKREVFEPLNLTGAGFGPPTSPDETLDQPRGHRPVLLGWKVAVDDTADNTPIMGPAGTVHMTLANLCTYAAEHLQGESGKGRLLSGESYKRLHTADLDDYACGWVVKEPTEAIPHRLYWHNGSNTMWYALVVFIPDKQMVVAVASNDGNIAKAESAAWEIVEAVAGQFDAEGDAELRKNLPGEAFSKRSPFAAVRWQNFQPEVRVGEEWFQLVSLDEIAAGDIVTYCRQNYGDKWQKRFEEDLVEVLTRMGHQPKDTVELVVCPVGSSTTQTLKGVPMTEANRRAIRAAAEER